MVASILGVAGSEAANQLAHSISFGIILALMTNIAQYVGHKCKSRRGKTHWQRWGPFYFCVIAVPLVILDILRHILMDAGMWTANSAINPSMFRVGCDDPTAKCLSVVGWIFTIMCTYTGYVLLIIGTVWAADLHIKIREVWRLRRA